MSIEYITVDQVVALHHEVMLDEGQQAILVSIEKLESAAARPQTESFGVELFPTLAEKAAALLQGIVIAHPFMDGNKRAGFAATMVFLRRNGFRQVVDYDAVYDLVIAVTTGELREVPDIAARLRELFPGLE